MTFDKALCRGRCSARNRGEVCDTTRTSRATGHVLHHPIHVYRVLYHNYISKVNTHGICARVRYFAYISGNYTCAPSPTHIYNIGINLKFINTYNNPMQLARVIRLSVNKSYQFIILEVRDTTRARSRVYAIRTVQ